MQQFGEMAPSPEYAASGGWALRGARPKGLSSRPAKGTMGSPVKPGMTGGWMPERAGYDDGNRRVEGNRHVEGNRRVGRGND